MGVHETTRLVFRSLDPQQNAVVPRWDIPRLSDIRRAVDRAWPSRRKRGAGAAGADVGVQGVPSRLVEAVQKPDLFEGQLGTFGDRLRLLDQLRRLAPAL